MEIDFSFLFEFNYASIFVRTFLAVTMGMFIGQDRSKKESPAGAKTHSLVCLGATMVMLLSEFCAVRYGVNDVTRMPAQVISGIGFLGAGMIMVTQTNHIKGLTSAAGIWFSACIGLAIGCGFYFGAFMGFFFEVFILKFYGQYQYRKAAENVQLFYIEYNNELNVGRLIKKLREEKCEVLSIDTSELVAFNNESRKYAILHIKSINVPKELVIKVIGNIVGILQIEDL